MKKVVYLAVAAGLATATVTVPSAFAARHDAKRTVVICTSTPYGVPALKGLSQGIRNGTTIAIKHLAPMLAGVGIKVQQVNYDYAKADGSGYDPSKEGTNARTCLGLKNSLGYVGTLNSGAALVSEPILNKGHLVMISPANTNPTLTDPKSRSSQEPATFKGKIKYVTYYRTVTTDKLQGPAGALYAKGQLKAKTFYLVNDGLQYGVGLANFFEKTATSKGMTESGKSQIDTSNQGPSSQTIAAQIKLANPDMVYCGCDSETSNLLPKDLRSLGYTKPFMGGDALVNSTWTSNSGAGTGAVNNAATSVGPDISRAAKFFSKLYQKYKKGFFKNPGIQAYDATAYDAAGVELTAIYDAAKAGKLKGKITAQRGVVVGYVHSIKFKGATGTTTFDKNGDTKNKIVSVYRTASVKGNLQWVFKFQLIATGSPV